MNADEFFKTCLKSEKKGKSKLSEKPRSMIEFHKKLSEEMVAQMEQESSIKKTKTIFFLPAKLIDPVF